MQLPRVIAQYEHGKELEDTSLHRIKTTANKRHTNKHTQTALFSTMDYTCFYHLQERLQQQKEKAGYTQISRQGQGGP